MERISGKMHSVCQIRGRKILGALEALPLKLEEGQPVGQREPALSARCWGLEG